MPPPPPREILNYSLSEMRFAAFSGPFGNFLCKIKMIGEIRQNFTEASVSVGLILATALQITASNTRHWGVGHSPISPKRPCTTEQGRVLWLLSLKRGMHRL